MFTHIVPGLDAGAPAVLKADFKLALEALDTGLSCATSENIKVSTVVAEFASGGAEIAHPFVSARVLRSDATEISDLLPRLPFLRDVCAIRADTDYVIYSQADIVISPFFYPALTRIISRGQRTFSVNRRTIQMENTPGLKPVDLYSNTGSSHSGTDLVVMPSEIWNNIVACEVVVGLIGLGRTLLLNAAVRDPNAKRLKDLTISFHREDSRSWASGAKATVGKSHNQSEFLKVVETLSDLFGSKRVEEAGRLMEIPRKFMA